MLSDTAVMIGGTLLKSFARLMAFQMRRAFCSKSLSCAVFLSIFFVAVCHALACFMLWGHDAGELPSAAVAWAANYVTMASPLFCAYIYFLMFPLSAGVFGDSLFLDRRKGLSSLICARSSERAYIVTGAVTAFMVGFAIVATTVLVSQAMAYAAFPVTSDQDMLLLTPDLGSYRAEFFQFVNFDEMPFSSLFISNRMLFNLVFGLYDAMWAGIFSLCSFAVSLYVRENRLLVIGLPTALYLVLSYTLPSSVSLGSHLILTTGGSYNHVFMIVAPLVCVLALVAAIAYPLACKKDVLL